MALVIALGTATSAQTVDGDQLLADAAAMKGVASYTVPVQFAVHLIRPIGLRSEVSGTAYYQAPGAGALVLNHATGLIGGFFKGTYHLDLVPQTWPANYRVTSVATATDASGPVTLLTAVPRTGGDDVAQVVFRIGGPGGAPTGATWTYRDGSSIVLAFTNAPAGAYTLPRAATVAVNMPKQQLEATATYGTYDFNATIDPRVFATPAPR